MTPQTITLNTAEARKIVKALNAAAKAKLEAGDTKAARDLAVAAGALAIAVAYGQEDGK